MSILASFMPWCRIQKAYEVDTIRIVPVAPVESLEQDQGRYVKTILATYRSIEGQPVDLAATVQWVGKSLVADVTEDERDVMRELVAVACFSGLAGRDHFNSAWQVLQ